MVETPELTAKTIDRVIYACASSIDLNRSITKTGIVGTKNLGFCCAIVSQYR